MAYNDVSKLKMTNIDPVVEPMGADLYKNDVFVLELEF